MKYVATIRLLAARPMKGAPLRMAPFEAIDEFAAARVAAMRCAKALYGERGQPGFATWRDGECRINIGEYVGGGLTCGVTAIVRVQPVE